MALYDNFVAVLLAALTSFTSSITGAPVPPSSNVKMDSVQVSINESIEQSQNENMISGVSIIDRAHNNRMKTGGYSHMPIKVESLGRLPILFYAIRVDDNVTRGKVPEIVSMVQGNEGPATDAMWERYGKNAIINDLKQRYNLQETIPGESWSDLRMSSVDVGRLIRRFLDDDGISSKKKAWAINLMRNTATNSGGNDLSFGLPNALGENDGEQRLSWMQGWSGTGSNTMIRSSAGVYGDDMRYIIVQLGEVSPSTTDEDANTKVNNITQKLVENSPFYNDDEKDEKAQEFKEKQEKEFPNTVGEGK